MQIIKLANGFYTHYIPIIDRVDERLICLFWFKTQQLFDGLFIGFLHKNISLIFTNPHSKVK